MPFKVVLVCALVWDERVCVCLLECMHTNFFFLHRVCRSKIENGNEKGSDNLKKYLGAVNYHRESLVIKACNLHSCTSVF